MSLLLGTASSFFPCLTPHASRDKLLQLSSSAYISETLQSCLASACVPLRLTHSGGMSQPAGGSTWRHAAKVAPAFSGDPSHKNFRQAILASGSSASACKRGVMLASSFKCPSEELYRPVYSLFIEGLTSNAALYSFSASCRLL